MADISITAASVVAGSNSVQERGIAGTTITAGQVVYKADATNKYMLADGDSATAEIRVPLGIALHGASLNQPLTIHKSGDITIGATLTAGTAYYLGDDPGGISPLADVASGDDVVLVGLAESTTVLNVDFQVTGVTL
jgi:hypothetical protein